MFTWRWAIPYRSGTFTVLDGSNSKMMRTWQQLWPNCRTRRFVELVPHTTTFNQGTQIEGFKLHVTHNNKPFTNRIRYAPEVASKPERLVKDLANVKTLAALLEEEYERVKRPLPEEKKVIPTDGAEEGTNGSDTAAHHEDAIMAEVEPQLQTEAEPDDDSEPKEKGSEAVERRIENIMNDLRESGTIDVNNEKELEEKRVSSYCFGIFLTCGTEAHSF